MRVTPCGKLLAVAPVNYLQPKLIRARGARRQQRLLGRRRWRIGRGAHPARVQPAGMERWRPGLESRPQETRSDNVNGHDPKGTLGCGRQPRGLRRRPRLAPGGSGAARDGIGRNQARGPWERRRHDADRPARRGSASGERDLHPAARGHDLAVIIDALAGRNGLSDKARSELSSRIRKLRIKGFRDANRAPHDRLVETILDTIAGGDHGLAAAILGTWMQTQSALRERAAAHLRGRGIDVVDAPPVRFTSCWDTDEWLLERNRMLQDSDGAYAHRDDAALMLSLVSGRFPAPPPVESELFKAWIDTLWELPASAPEWPADAANLGKWIRYILREKERGIIEGVVHKIADQWNGIENEFNDDLHYLGIGPITLQALPGGPELLIGTLEFLTALRVQLEAYRPLRPQAASRQEEIERSEARRAAEEGILKLTAEWQDRMARARQAQEAATAAQRAEPAVDEEEPPTGKEADEILRPSRR